ncbi:MAG: amidohydrolase family protein [Planctomycetota bacterium]|jgi:predicted TIM-barrel fold metal-dependent hydrolase
MQKIIDFHTHAFPDALAERAMAQLLSETDQVQSFLDGKLSSLIASMDANGIQTSILCSIATKPSHFEPVFQWSQQIRSDRIVPLASVHPRDPDGVEHVHKIAQAGLKGVKMHPYYQDFYMDDPQLDTFYEAIQAEGLLLTMHTGYDFAFDWIDRASPAQISAVIEKFPDLKLVTTHLGGWQQWDAVEELLIGKPIYMETSFSTKYLNNKQLMRMLLAHPSDYILFGTDSPWTDQAVEIEAFEKLGLPGQMLDKIFYQNARTLLDPL